MGRFIRSIWLVPVVALAACARKSGPARTTPENPAVLEVENRGFADMVIYAVSGSQRVRLGLATGNSTKSFTIPAALWTRGTLTALDIDPLMVELVDEKAGQLGLKNVRGVVRDFVSDGTGLADASQMHAMIFNLLHIEDPLALLAEVRRIVKPNGSASVIHWRSDVPTPRGPPQEIRPSPQQCRDWLQEAGFSTVTTIDVADACPYHFALLAR